MKFILGIIAVLTIWVMPVKAENQSIEKLVEALRLAAPQTGTENDGLYSDWQVKAENILRWSRLCPGKQMTVEEFEANTTKARKVLECVMEDILNEQYAASGNDESLAVRRAAAWWMTGDPEQYNQGETANYTNKVLDFYQKQK
ncbi:hypothetical protein [Hydrocoleum sp. CS-953]|uniref:hypothetical protein n=1 Tax=Microcoleaceae TaxID=1892252 RepID=UPI000B9B8B2C|nr:hypothetical protein [Hydrocoleum sp. CS-953]OZH54914.1 hypothetical protein AFK68_07865 [Hydrocoleum sp. CS-953]